MKKILLGLFIFFVGELGMYAQKVSPKNSTYFRVDNRDLSNLIQWTGETYTDIAIGHDSVTNVSGIELKIAPKNFMNLKKAHLSPFTLDAIHRNSSGYNYFYSNGSFFDWMSAVDATSSSVKTKVIGKLHDGEKMNMASVKDLFRLCILFGVVSVYIHLHGEIIITKEKEDTKMIEIGYH